MILVLRMVSSWAGHEAIRQALNVYFFLRELQGVTYIAPVTCVVDNTLGNGNGSVNPPLRVYVQYLPLGTARKHYIIQQGNAFAT